MPQALCRVCLARMGETTEELRALVLRWLLDKEAFVSHREMSDADLLSSPRESIALRRQWADDLLTLLAAQSRPTLEEPPF